MHAGPPSREEAVQSKHGAWVDRYRVRVRDRHQGGGTEIATAIVNQARKRTTRAPEGAAPAIQPRGFLIVLDAETLRIERVSANAGNFLDRAPDKIIGTAIVEHVDEAFAQALAGFAAAAGRMAGPSGPIALRGAGAGRGWISASHRSGNRIIVEIAPLLSAGPDLGEFLVEATAALKAVREHAGIEATATTVARRLREMTGYDQVLVLRFDAQDHAHAIAESKSSGAGPSLLGLRLPAQDVPARAIFGRSAIRMIDDLTAAPVPILPATGADGEALDLGEAILAALPPAQVQLLAGAGARAALVMSLVRDRRVWGLIAFLHRAPRHLPLSHRSTLQLMADAIAVRFGAAEDQERERALARRRRALAGLRDAYEREAGENIAASLRRHALMLLRVTGAGGAWCHLAEADFALGRVPTGETARRIAALCRVRAGSGIFATDHLAGLDPALAKDSAAAAGALFVALPRSRGALVLLRGEALPPEPGERRADRCVARREATWRHARKNRAEPWSDVDLEIAREAGAVVDELQPRLAERRNVHRVLENEAKLRAILDATQDGLIVVDRHGTVLEFSPGAERLFRHASAEIVGQPVERLVPEALRAHHRAGLERAASALETRTLGGGGELLGLRKDGTTFPFELTVTSLVLGGETLFIGALRDIGERLAGEQRDRFWFEQSSVGYSVSVADGERRLRVNPALSRMLGYSERELLSLTVLDTMHPGDAPAAMEWRAQVRAGNDKPYRTLQRFVRKDGKIVWGRVTASPIRAPGSARAEIVSEVVEITDLMEADAKLRAALTRAEAASASKSQFLATMSHELRTPLNAIIGLSEMMNDEVMGPLGNARYAEYVRDIHRAGRHLLDLVTDVLDTSRIEAGGYRLALAPLAAKDVVEETLRLVAPLAGERGISIERSIAADLPLLSADRRALKQILVNVMSNALKYTPRNGCVGVEARPERGGVAIVVADTGSGIAPEDLAHVTEPFYRAGNVYTSRAAGGAGLGLAIARGLVEAHSGSLAIASKVGEGTTVTLRFPAASPAP